MKLPHIQVTMLGTTGAGKTCFLLGMYATMRMGANRFTFTTDEDTDLGMSDQWELLMAGEGNERWPQPNDNVVHHYSFDFCYALKKFASFDWVDYRGGALRDRSTAEDRQELKRFMMDSDCVICCVPADVFLNSAKDRFVSSTETSRKAVVPRMLQLLQELPPDKRPAIAIVITKYDLIAQSGSEQVIEAIKNVFNPLFAPNGKWEVLICPISLGKELAQNPNSGEIDPKNVHLPVTYAMYYALQHSLEEQAQQLVETEKLRKASLQQSQEAEARRNIFTGKNQEARENRASSTQGYQRADATHSRLTSKNFLSRWWNKSEIASAQDRASSYRDDVDRYKRAESASQYEIERAEQDIKVSHEQAARAEREMQELLKLQDQMERSLKMLVSELMSTTSTYYNGEAVHLEA